jgi:protein tyrosine phosphatase (PTP) superfamily phosphohydrolase (DUF442 family)
MHGRTATARNNLLGNTIFCPDLCVFAPLREALPGLYQTRMKKGAYRMHKNKKPRFWYTLIEGITVSEYPSDRFAEDTRRLQEALERGCTAFVDLTEPGENGGFAHRPLPAYEPLLHELAEQAGVSVAYHRFPVPDLTAPPVEQMRHILATIDDLRGAGHHVLVHCLGGIGRSAAVAGCYLVRHGWSADEALRHIQQQVDASPKSGLTSPEMSSQIALVRAWAKQE